MSTSHHVSRFQPKNVKIILNESIPTLPNGATTYATYMEQKMKARMCSIVIHFWLLFGNVLNTTAYLLADTASLHLPQRVLCYSKFWHNKLVASTITAQSTLVYCRLRLTIGPTGSSSACKTEFYCFQWTNLLFSMNQTLKLGKYLKNPLNQFLG